MKILLVILLLLPLDLLATGPSHMESSIRPISMNEEGFILCRTKYYSNPMGAHRFMPIEYGLSVITSDSIIEYLIYTLYPDSFETWEQFEVELYLWDSLHKTGLTLYPNADLEKELIEMYNFSSIDLSKYEVDSFFAYRDTSHKYQNISELTQHSLHYEVSTYNTSDTFHIVYDFGNILILNSYSGFEISEETEDDILVLTGPVFDYYNPWVNENGEEENIGFEIYSITGVAFLKKE